MGTEANKAVVRRFFKEIYNHQRLDLCDELQDPEYAAFEREWLPIWRTAFPDLHATVHTLIAEGDLVVASVTISGTHQVEIKGELIRWLTDPIPPMGKHVEVKGIVIYRIMDGKLAADHDGVALTRHVSQPGGRAPSVVDPRVDLPGIGIPETLPAHVAHRPYGR